MIVSALREQLRRYILEDEEIQMSTSNEITRELVEPNVNVVNNRYEIPVPLKVDVVETLPNNYAYALDRNFLLRKSALKNNSVKKTLIDTFHEIISNEWLVLVDSNSLCKPCWYLPFFVTSKLNLESYLMALQHINVCRSMILCILVKICLMD